MRNGDDTSASEPVAVAMKLSCPPPTAMWYAADHGVIHYGAPHTQGGQPDGVLRWIGRAQQGVQFS